MDIVQYLKDIYGYATPIFLKDIRIGHKSKTAIRKELSRAVAQNRIIRSSNGIYCFKEQNQIPMVSFERVVEKKYIKDDFGIPGLDLDIYGYYSGQTFLHMIGISQEVPAVLEITTNNTSCKREININGRRAILRKGRVEINRLNYKALQFFDMLSSFIVDEDIKENKELLVQYVKQNLTKKDFVDNIKFYSSKVMKIIVENDLIDAFE